jgi:hypothetical protein
MGLRRQRRSLVVWSQSEDPYRASQVARRARPRRIRRWIRVGMLLTLLGLVRVVRPRWKPLMAGTAFTVAGIIMRGLPAGSILLLPGLMLLMGSPLIAGPPGAERTKLERELAGYCTAAQRQDLEATLDRYPDDVTRELRDILADQASARAEDRFPALGRR